MKTAIVAVLFAFLLNIYYGEAEVIPDLFSTSYKQEVSKIVNSADSKHPKNIGIIGGGIGGSTASLFLRSLFGDDVTIDLYEPGERLCGRVRVLEMMGRSYECGGSILHPKNLYAKHLAQHFDLPKREDNKHYGDIEFWNKNEKQFTMNSGDSGLKTLFYMIWEFQFSIIKMFMLIKEFIGNFLNIYEIQNDGKSYSSVRELLKGITPDEKFYNSTQKTACEMLINNKGISEELTNVLVNGALLVNYGQDCNLNGFAGAVGISGFESGTWAVNGGNYQLCENSVGESRANHIRSAVNSVEFNAGDKKFSVSSNGNLTRSYDIVILASPLYYNGPAIDVAKACSNGRKCPTNKKHKQSYRSTVATFIYGRLNSTTFECKNKECPITKINTVEDSIYRSIALQAPADYSSDEDELLNEDKIGVYKIFSTRTLTDSQLDYLFEIYKEKKEVPWKAYPKFQPPEHLESFVLNEEGFYYTSPIEWSASAIEMSIISAKNAALLAFNNWFGL